MSAFRKSDDRSGSTRDCVQAKLRLRSILDMTLFECICANDPIKKVLCYADTARRSARKVARLTSGPTTQATPLRGAILSSGLSV